MSNLPAKLVMVVEYDGAADVNTAYVSGLAEVLGYTGSSDIDIRVVQLQALGEENLLVDVSYTVVGNYDFDENGMAYPQVTVTFPDGHTESDLYMIDGNS